MSKLNKKINDVYIRLKNEAIYGVYGKRYIPKKDDGTNDYTQDFPSLEDPTDYVTHIPMEQENLEEAKKKPEEAEEAPPEEEEGGGEEGEEPPPDEEGGEGGMEGGEEGMPPEGMEGGGDPTAAGMPGAEPPPLTSNQIGRVYELKKIYSRLSSVESFLSRTTDDQVLEIKKQVSNAIDLFELVISNFEQYKDKVDEIIVMYYKFLKVVYESIKDHFKRISKQ